MEPKAILTGSVGALIGTALWAGIMFIFDIEFGWIAWLVGGIVGLGARMGGGHGVGMGILAAILTLFSIFFGKIIVYEYFFQSNINETIEANSTVEIYNEIMQDASDFSEILAEEDYPQFMVRHAYTEVASASNLVQEEVAYFKEHWVPRLRRYHRDQITYEQWAVEARADMQNEVAANVNSVSLAIDDLNFYDLIFAVLGMVTAFQVVARQEE